MIKVGDLIRQKIGANGEHLTDSVGLVVDIEDYDCPDIKYPDYRVLWCHKEGQTRVWLSGRQLHKIEKRS